ncbi:MAG: PilZ domain-containing protein [Kangiellaceae bacterium]|nr:PilZ domain-containing protein [Kangiellaceae bacterium]
MPDNLEDLRRENRSTTEKTISVSFSNKKNGTDIQVHQCRLQDISSGGLKILTHISLPLGTVKSIAIDLGKPRGSIQAKAEIRWCLEIDETPTYFLGIKLVEFTKKDLNIWQNFVKIS